MSQSPDHIQKIARSGGLSMAGAAVSAVAGVLLVIVITRGLDKQQAGTIFTTTSLFLVAMAIVQLGADVGLVRWLPNLFATESEHNVTATLKAAFIPVLALSLVVGMGAIATAPLVADLFGSDYSSAISKQLMVLGAFLPIAAIYNLVLAATRAFRTMRPTVLVDSVGRYLTQLGLVFAVSALGLGSVAFVVAWATPYPFALGAAGAWLMVLMRRSLRSARANGRPERAADPDMASQFWRYTTPRGVATIAQTLLKRSDIILVAALTKDPAQTALYAAATRFVVFGQLAVQALQLALAPQMSATLARGEKDMAQDVYRTTTAWAMVLAWPVYIASAVLAPWLLMIFSRSYSQAAPVVVILSLAMLVATACGSVDTVLLMAGRSWLSLLNTGIALVVNLGLNFVLIPKIGIVGAAISWAIAILIRNFLPLGMINKMLGMSPFGSGSAWVAVSAVACVGVVPTSLRLLDAPFSAVLAAVLVGGIFYLAAIWWGRDRIHLGAFRAVLGRRRTAATA
ncbi:MAG: polysaccharide biosynthesis C-terminal domain-containing protein [Actinomycetes bacterium]